MPLERIFWFTHLPLALIALIAIGSLFITWKRGAAPGTWTLREMLKTAFTGHFWRMIGRFFTEAWFNRRLWRSDRLRWGAHFCLLTGFLILISMSALSALSEKIIIPLFDLERFAWASAWLSNDHPFKAFVNDFGSLLMTAGWLYYVIRRFVSRPAQLRTNGADVMALVILGIILLSGWATEIARLNIPGLYDPALAPLAFIGWPLSRLFADMEVNWLGFYEGMYLFHGIFFTVILVALPFTKFMHVFAGGFRAMLAAVAPPATAPLARGYSFLQMVEMDACTRCGECVTWCPTYQHKQKLDSITPLRKIEAVRREIRSGFHPILKSVASFVPGDSAMAAHAEGTYDCTLCGRCGAVCPVHIGTRDMWIAMRESLVDQGRHPASLDVLREKVASDHNLSGETNENRTVWMENLPAEIRESISARQQAETVYFVGCVAAMYPQSYAIPQGMTEVMRAAGEDFIVLGGEEWCCGFPLRIAGMGDAAVESARHNVDAVRRTGARRLVATCPSCYHSWAEDYPRLLGEELGFEVVHATQLLADLVTRGRLAFKPLEETVTYHDPCDLGRTSGIYDAPRQIISAVPGVTFVEMAHHHDMSLCCGGGGDVEMSDTDLTSAIAHSRVAEADAVEAKILVSACQQCVRTLAKSARADKLRIRVMDIVEVAARQLETPEVN